MMEMVAGWLQGGGEGWPTSKWVAVESSVR